MTIARSLSPAEWVDQAADLLQLGFHFAAGAVARIAIEQWLQDLCEETIGRVSGLANGTALAKLLHTRGLLAAEVVIAVRRLYRLACKASHGGNVTAERIAMLVEDVRRLLESKVSVDRVALA